MAVFTPMEEVERIITVAWDMVERGVRDFFREGRVEGPIMMLTEVLEEVVVLEEREGVGEAGEGTLEEAVEMMKMIPVEEGEVLIIMEKISRMIVVTKKLVMVKSPLHYCKKAKPRANHVLCKDAAIIT